LSLFQVPDIEAWGITLNTGHVEWITICLAFCGLFFVAELRADGLPSEGSTARSTKGMVVTVSRPASEVGRDILNAGGNAVDAAVAVGFALTVTWPEAGNVGGGGFMLVHPPGRAPTFFDYRESAPAAATVDMFVNERTSQYPLVGVPGTVRGLQLAHQRYGKLSWQTLVQPSVKLAREGIEVSEELAGSLNGVLKADPNNEELQRVFKPSSGRNQWQAGDRLVQPDLAETLQTIALDGADAFYTGKLAARLEAEMKRGGGLITVADLSNYRARERVPVHGVYRGYDVYSSPPPSSGGTVLVEMLNIAERFDLRREGRWSSQTLHVMIESMRLAYLDRARHLGDPDFNSIPTHLTTKEYAQKLTDSISLTNATASAELGADILTVTEREHTTHFSIIDQYGMAVSNTYTLEDSFGSRIVVRGAGYLLNNEMGDFNPKPGVTSNKGLIGTKANLVAPAKRMLSSMTPTIVAKNGRPVLITGSPGGRTIINTVFCVALNVLEFDMPIRDAVDAPRFHHAWMPDNVHMEPALLSEHAAEISSLRQMGHAIDSRPVRQGDAHSISITGEGDHIGAADGRRHGWAAGQ